MAWAGPATADSQLAHLFTKRSTTEPPKASSVGILSTYPPTQCGIATFTASLTAALTADTPNVSVGIVRIGPTPQSHDDPPVVLDLPGHTESDNRHAARYRVDPQKVILIPHGAPVGDEPVRMSAQGRRPTVLTWGLLGPGKGIEWGTDALSAMSLQRLQPRYLIAGQTHPKVLAREGESYRESLVQRAESRGVGHLVDFEPGYISPQRLRELLRELLREADVVLLPYDSHEQITSGVLIEAMASLVPVVSTTFPHAVDLLGDGRGGTLVPHEDPAAVAAALTRILFESGVAAAMSAHNATLAKPMSWPAVAGRYQQLLNALMRRPSVPRR